MADRRGAALQRLRGAHETALLAELRRSGGLSRSELIERSGLSRTTVFAIVSDLLASKTLVERPRAASGGTDGQDPATQGASGTGTSAARGRPAMSVFLNPRGAQLIGIGLLRTRLQIVIANHAHELVSRCTVPLAAEAGPGERVAAVGAAVDAMVAAHGISLAAVAGVGLGLPGLVRRRDQEPPDAASAEARIVSALGERFGTPVLTDNNTRLAALAETTWGAARDLSHIVYLQWSDRVGGGLVIDGRLVRGAHGAAGEIGHTSCDPQGPPCYCGGRGCLEGVIGLPALVDRCRARGVDVRDGAHLLALAASGQPAAVDVVREAAATAGRVLAGLAVQIDPAAVIVAGELAGLGAPVLAAVREQLETLALPGAALGITVAASTLGSEAAAQGAVAMLLRAAGNAPDGLASAGAA